eukprot:GHVR01148340.1.p1 GENE.GHVR01148340.1~~GHVR01148340.1.p1  ORF type:complete len:366 (+),score=169.89 GHVR01148340.1:379-1476(+)
MDTTNTTTNTHTERLKKLKKYLCECVCEILEITLSLTVYNIKKYVTHTHTHTRTHTHTDQKLSVCRLLFLFFSFIASLPLHLVSSLFGHKLALKEGVCVTSEGVCVSGQYPLIFLEDPSSPSNNLARAVRVDKSRKSMGVLSCFLEARHAAYLLALAIDSEDAVSVKRACACVFSSLSERPSVINMRTQVDSPSCEAALFLSRQIDDTHVLDVLKSHTHTHTNSLYSLYERKEVVLLESLYMDKCVCVFKHLPGTVLDLGCHTHTHTQKPTPTQSRTHTRKIVAHTHTYTHTEEKTQGISSKRLSKVVKTSILAKWGRGHKRKMDTLRKMDALRGHINKNKNEFINKFIGKTKKLLNKSIKKNKK